MTWIQESIMAEQTPKHILLCVAGLTPQIITESLYALTQQRGERVDEIRVITTLAGRDRIMDHLLDEEHGRFFRFCDDFGINRTGIKFDRTCIYLLHRPDGTMLEDIRSVEDNEIAANQICEIVRELTAEPNTRIHASAAGGRKTMSIYLTAAMQLFGRAPDQLSHVLVSEDFETRPDFFYKPPTSSELEVKDRQGNVIKRLSTDAAEIHLADIPFIRLRGLITDWTQDKGRSYGELVLRAQDDLDFLESDYEVWLNPCEYNVSVKTRSATLTPREFFVYALFAHFRQRNSGDNGFLSLDRITVDDLAGTFRYITAARGEVLDIEECESYPGFDFLPIWIEQIRSKKEKDLRDLRKSFTEIISKINRNLNEDAGLPAIYLIHNTGPRGSAKYGLKVPAEKTILS
jgi:CRISPR-associated protein (TIGR02584 family)